MTGNFDLSKALQRTLVSLKSETLTVTELVRPPKSEVSNENLGPDHGRMDKRRQKATHDQQSSLKLPELS